MDFELNYGKGTISFSLEERNFLYTLKPKDFSYCGSEEETVRLALMSPIGTKRLKDIVKSGEKAVIITSDRTRPMPSAKVLPAVIGELEAGGIKAEDITIVIALGTHTKCSENNLREIVGDAVYESPVSVINSDLKDCVFIGKCRSGLPVYIYRKVIEADRIICMGNIEFHYFAGYSGGCKALMPGVAGRITIKENHAGMLKGGAFSGNLDTNPVRMEIEEAGRLAGVDFIVNVVLDDKKKIIDAVAGNPFEAHRKGCRILDAMYKIPIKDKADIVVVSSGGYPKDLDLYQAQKSLENAKYAVKKGGIIIWCVQASEGFGNDVFGNWMVTKTKDEILDKIKKDFMLGVHKAAAISLVKEHADIFAVTDLDEGLVRKIGLIPMDSVSKALEESFVIKGKDAKVAVMPFGGSTLPVYKGEIHKYF